MTSDWRDRLEQFDSREAWLKARRTGIGASDWAAILNVDGAFGTAFSTWADKAGKTEIDAEVPEFVEWGNHLEPIVAREFGKRVEKPVTTFDHAIVRNEEFPWLTCSPDGFVGQQARSGYEGKVSNAYRRADWYEGVPLIYRIQCIASMYVTGLTSWYVACLIGGNELVWKRIEYDDEAVEFIDAVFPKLDRFWKSVQSGEMPNPKGTERDRKIITSLYPQDNGTEASLPHEHAYLVDQRIAAMKQKKDAEAIIAGVDCMTRLAMGEHSLAVFKGRGKYTWRTSAKTGIRTLRFTKEK